MRFTQMASMLTVKLVLYTSNYAAPEGLDPESSLCLVMTSRPLLHYLGAPHRSYFPFNYTGTAEAQARPFGRIKSP